jgi:hypothetical protein
MKIIKSKTISDLEKITRNDKVLIKNKLNTTDYPKINFTIQVKEIDYLLQKGLIDTNYNFIESGISRLKNPLAKLLYSMAWKNNDLKKMKHIIEGIKDENEYKKTGIVFYQFGKHLRNIGEPIVDQHVLRAFSVYYSNKSKEPIIEVLNTITDKHKILIKNYKEWLISDDIDSELKSKNDYIYHIDKILFAAGKTIKKRKDE